MSEALTPDVAEPGPEPSDEAAFEAAREAEGADEAAPEGEQAAEGEEPEARKPVDWEKRAMDKEGLAAKERARRREAERQNRALAERVERLEADRKPAAQGGETLEGLIETMPDPEEDPVGATAHIAKIVKLFGQQQAAETEQETTQQRQAGEIRSLVGRMSEAEAEFAEDHPDYEDAMKHFKAARQADFEDMGYAGQELQRALADDLLGLVKRCLSSGKDPAETAYNLAKKRGFKAGDKATKDSLKEIAAAAKAGATPQGGRTGEDGVMTAEAINRLKGPAYDKAWAKLQDQMKRAG